MNCCSACPGQSVKIEWGEYTGREFTGKPLKLSGIETSTCQLCGNVDPIIPQITGLIGRIQEQSWFGHWIFDGVTRQWRPELNLHATQLIAALRSGKYLQGRGFLTIIEDDIEKDCCLGVACKLAVENGQQMTVEYRRSSLSSVLYGGERHYLPQSIIDYYGFRTLAGEFRAPLCITTPKGECHVSGLASANDELATFLQIADIIESAPVGLFCKPA